MDQPQPKPRRLCRHLTVNGRQCQQNARRDGQFCVAHEKHRHPVCPQKGGKVVVPLLEDVSAIQLVASQVAHGLFTETLDPWRAGKILYACQVAAMTVPRPAPVKSEPVDDDGAVAEPFTDLNGELLGPDQPWSSVDADWTPVWNHHKHLYEEECERLKQPMPLGPEDFPANGWLSKEEAAEYLGPRGIHLFPGNFQEKILQVRIQREQRGDLPALEQRACAYGDGSWCGGPSAKSRCAFCKRERAEHLRLHPQEEATPPGAPFKPSSGCCGSDDSVFIDDPEETEVLDSHKVTLLNMHHCADDVGTLPPLEQRTCFYSMPDCAGPASPNPCTYCRRERDYYRKLHKDDTNLDLNASAAQELCHPERAGRTRRACCRAANQFRPRVEGPAVAGCPISPAVGEMGRRFTKIRSRARQRASLLPQAPGSPASLLAGVEVVGAGAKHRSRPAPRCQHCQHRQIPQSTRSPQPTAVPGRPPQPQSTSLRYPVGNTPYGSSPGISLRSLRNHHQPTQRVVDHSMRRRAAQRSAVEHRSGQRFRRAALLRRVARAGVHQPLV